jgi:hypothetical protein
MRTLWDWFLAFFGMTPAPKPPDTVAEQADWPYGDSHWIDDECP